MLGFKLKNMKKITSAAIMFAFLMMSSCAKFLDQVPQEILTEQTLFSNKDNLVKLLTQCYAYPPEGDFGGYLPESFFRRSIGSCGGEAIYTWVA
ncbi:MAG: hypothetical protein CRN43_11910, partial [Candidatus Nephrothrix sp. EaCA]